jgi:hypothetical protein
LLYLAGFAAVAVAADFAVLAGSDNSAEAALDH